jgi:hypothetical protein
MNTVSLTYGTRGFAPIMDLLFRNAPTGTVDVDGHDVGHVYTREDIQKMAAFLVGTGRATAQEVEPLLNRVGPKFLTIATVVTAIEDYNTGGFLTLGKKFEVCRGCTRPGKSPIGHFYLPEKHETKIEGFNFGLNVLMEECRTGRLRADVAIVLLSQLLSKGVLLKSPPISKTEERMMVAERIAIMQMFFSKS